MMERISFFLKHAFVHLFLYAIPRLLHALVVRIPRRILCWLRRVPPPPSERAVLMVVNEEEPAMIKVKLQESASGVRIDAKEAFGLTEHMKYDGPLYNGHIHTILGGMRVPVKLNYTREVVEAHGGQHLHMDQILPSCAPESIRGMFFVIPGLLNASTTAYVKHFSQVAADNNFAVCVLNYRGMGSTPLEVPRLFSATFTDDIRDGINRYLKPEQVQKRLGTSEPVPLIGVGFSLGGITLIKYVSEEAVRAEKEKQAGPPCPLAAVIAITSPFDLITADRCTRRPSYHYFYEKPFAVGFRKYMRHNREVLEKLPNVADDMFQGDHPRVNTIRSIHDFDLLINASHNGFSAVDDYYRAANSIPLLYRVRTPVLCVTNAGDPVAGVPIPADQWTELVTRNPYVAYLCGPCGGHLGFLGGPIEEWKSAPNECEKLIMRSAAHVCEALRKKQ